MATTELSPSALLFQKARERLDLFGPLAHTIVTGPLRGQRAYPAPHHAKMIAALQDDSLGHTLIVAPPGSAKTNWVLWYCEWTVGRDPHVHIGYFSNIYAQSEARSVAVRTTVEENEVYRAIFPVQKGNGIWTGQQWTVRRPAGDKDPTFFAANPGTGIGWRFDRIIFDDIADEENMSTDLQRDKMRAWLDKTAMSRLSPGGRAIMICTRWHENDPAEWAMRAGWHTVHIPALDDDGESYWPEYFPKEKLQAEALRMGDDAFQLMYQGRVVSKEGGRIRREWFQTYDAYPECRTIQSWDTAYSDREQAAYSVGLTWGVDRSPEGAPAYYLLDVYRARPRFPDLKRAVVAMYEKWHPSAVLVEDRASGQSILQELRVETHMPLIPVKVWGKSKEARVNSVDGMAPMIEAGRVYLPSERLRQGQRLNWVGDYLHEVTTVPYNQYWDQVDASTLFFDWIRQRQSVRPQVTLRMVS